jgi:hypothetical protein
MKALLLGSRHEKKQKSRGVGDAVPGLRMLRSTTPRVRDADGYSLTT